MTTFLEALQAHKSEAPPHVVRVLGMRNGNRKNRILERMEGHARTHLGVGMGDAVDWESPPKIDPVSGKMMAGTFDWGKLLAFLEKILPLLLALFGL